MGGELFLDKINYDISVIVPMYNVEKRIKTCLSSLRAQTMVNYEVILVDDGSTDNTEQICRDFCESNEHFSYYRKENGGSASARNFGLDVSKGEYIAFVDADDFVSSRYLELMYEIINQTKCDIAQCSFVNVRDNQINEKPFNENTNVEIISRINAIGMYFNHKRYLSLVVLWNKLYKRSLFENVKFVEGKSTDDEYVILELLNNTNQIAIFDAVLYAYVQTSNSQMRSSVSDKKILDVLDLAEYRMDFFRKLGDVALYDKCMCNFCSVIRGQLYYCKHHYNNIDKDMLNKYKIILKENRNNVFLSKNVDLRSKGLFFLKMYFTPIFYWLRNKKRKLNEYK